MKRVFKWIVTILGYVGIIAVLDGIRVFDTLFSLSFSQSSIT